MTTQIKIHGKNCLLIESGRGDVTVSYKGIVIVASMEPREKASLVSDSAGWQKAMRRLRAQAIGDMKRSLRRSR